VGVSRKEYQAGSYDGGDGTEVQQELGRHRAECAHERGLPGLGQRELAWGSFERVSFLAFSGGRRVAGRFNSFVTPSRPEGYM
jgi:hypothetical protein